MLQMMIIGNCVIVKSNLIAQLTEIASLKELYKARVLHKNKKHIYIGSTGREFKSRYYEHIQTFRNEVKKENTRFIHKIKNKNENIDWNSIIKWKIIHQTNQKSPGGICTLCNLERLEIAFTENNKLLNLRSELVGKCRQFPKFYLKS